MPKYNVEIEHKLIYVFNVEADNEQQGADKAWELFENHQDEYLAWDDFWVNDIEEIQ